MLGFFEMRIGVLAVYLGGDFGTSVEWGVEAGRVDTACYLVSLCRGSGSFGALGVRGDVFLRWRRVVFS